MMVKAAKVAKVGGGDIVRSAEKRIAQEEPIARRGDAHGLSPHRNKRFLVGHDSCGYASIN
jgi:hypothetical protein